jgi:adenylate cyclase
MLIPDSEPAQPERSAAANESGASAGLDSERTSVVSNTAASVQRRIAWPRTMVLALALALLAGTAAWVAMREPVSAPSAKVSTSALGPIPALSLVVLPLSLESDMSGGEWFADALLGDLTTQVARLQGSFVIARDTAHTYKGKAVDPRAVAKELGVRYVVRGSLRQDGRSMRLNLVLIDGETGGQRWAEKFDFERAHLNKALDDIVLQLARFLSIALWQSAGDRSATLSPAQVTADDLSMRAFAIWVRGFTRENANEALRLLEEAATKDPNSIRGWSGIAFVSFQVGFNNWVPDRAAAFRRAEEATRQLERLDPDGVYTYQAKVIQAFLKKDWPGVLRLSQMWVEQHPYHPPAYGGHGMSLISNGRAQEAVPYLERALRLSPRDSFRAEWQYRLALAHFTLGQYELAYEWASTAQAANPSLPWPPVHAAALVRLGRNEEARRVFEGFIARHSTFDQSHVSQRLNASHPAFVEARDRLIASLREVGLR